ncbi:hypothetical protein D9F77_15805 [Escherichia coli]|nr:hypothetical protein [Escherichia coli]
MELKWTSKALSDLVPLNAAAISEGIPLAYNKYNTVEKKIFNPKKIIFQDKVLNNDCFLGF